MLVLAGSLPPSMPKDIYAKWLAQLQSKGLLTVVDATGEMLLAALPYKPFLIKPNHHELGDLFGVAIDSREKAALYGRKLQEMGARNVLVSMSGDGAVLCAEYRQTAKAASIRELLDIALPTPSHGNSWRAYGVIKTVPSSMVVFKRFTTQRSPIEPAARLPLC